MKPELNHKLKTIRHDYSINQLSENIVKKDPLKQFDSWLHEAFEHGDEMANAFILSTVNEFDVPSSRVVLLRDLSHGGFNFFTNYLSRKGKDMAKNKIISILFFWKELQRQVRIEGSVQFLSEEESNIYFQSRPRESQLAALASEQSNVISSRDILENKFVKLCDLYKNKTVPKPPHWGGYVLIPNKIEFWQGRESRLHDRIQYTSENNLWKIERLAP
jgi:pyridoxamine 5'-phosphate oxidase